MTVPARVVAAAVIAALAVGLLYVNRPDRSAIGGPSPTPSAGPSEPAASPPSATPTATPTATPSPTLTPILWTEASLTEDWPAPVRPEPAGGAILVPILTQGRHIDPSGDTGSDGFPWIDIQEVRVYTHVVYFTLPEFPPDVDPTEQWIAYGVVFDDDRDGVPDRRVGMDNTPQGVSAFGKSIGGWDRYRVWITDLHTGRTTVQGGDQVGETYVNGWSLSHGRFSFGHYTPNGGGELQGTSLVNRPLYLWASVIQDGRVVATDYGPDVGWLDTSLETTMVP